MHELSLAQGLVDQVLAVAEGRRATRVVGLRVEIGPYAGVERDALEMAFPVAAEGTPLEGARLDIEETPAAVRCRACGRETRPSIVDVACTACRSLDVEIVDGRQFLLKSIELETEE